MVNNAESLRYFFALYKIPIPRDILPLMWFICDSKVRWLSTITPRNLVWFDILIFSLSTTRSLSMWIFPLRFLNIMKWVFFKFKDNLLMFNQSIIFSFRYSFAQLVFQDIYQRGTDLNHPRKEGEIKHRKLLTDHWYTAEITMDQEWILGVLRM